MLDDRRRVPGGLVAADVAQSLRQGRVGGQGGVRSAAGTTADVLDQARKRQFEQVPTKVSVVAQQVGFTSANGFILAFGRYFGVTPKVYATGLAA